LNKSSFFGKLLVRLGLLLPEDPNSEEALRARGVQIGENVSILNSKIDFGHGFLISIGNNVTLTGVHILSHDASTKIPLGYSKVGKVTIGDEVFVGHGTIILPGVRIGSRVVVGAGSVVARDIPDNSVVAGNPARVICTYDDFLEKHKAMMETRPIYHNHWREKTPEEKERMRCELCDGIGYDM